MARMMASALFLLCLLGAPAAPSAEEMLLRIDGFALINGSDETDFEVYPIPKSLGLRLILGEPREGGAAVSAGSKEPEYARSKEPGLRIRGASGSFMTIRLAEPSKGFSRLSATGQRIYEVELAVIIEDEAGKSARHDLRLTTEHALQRPVVLRKALEGKSKQIELVSTSLIGDASDPSGQSSLMILGRIESVPRRH